VFYRGAYCAEHSVAVLIYVQQHILRILRGCAAGALFCGQRRLKSSTN
jgi:hypothetical protein